MSQNIVCGRGLLVSHTCLSYHYRRIQIYDAGSLQSRPTKSFKWVYLRYAYTKARGEFRVVVADKTFEAPNGQLSR